MCFFDHLPISAKFDQDICVMGQKTLTVKYLYCTFKFTISKIDHMGKNGENFRVCKKNSTIWTQLELAVFEFFLDFAWVFSRFCLSFEFFWAWVFFTMSKKKKPWLVWMWWGHETNQLFNIDVMSRFSEAKDTP